MFTKLTYTLWLFHIDMENDPFIDDFPTKTSIYNGFSMAMLNNQMVTWGSPGPCRCHGSPGRRPPAALGRFPVAERLGVRLDALALRAGHPEWRHGQGDGGPERGERNSRDDRLVGGLEHFIFFHIFRMIFPTD